MSGLAIEVARRGRVATLVDVACRAGRGDRPYPEAHERGVWTVALVRRGTFRYRGSETNRAHGLRPGWLLFGRPGAGYECAHDHDGGDDCACLALAEDVLWDVARAGNVRDEKILSSPPVLPPIARVTALVERARARDTADVDEIGYLVAEAVLAHASRAPALPMALHPTHVRRVHDAIERIEASCADSLSLADLAASAALSPFHFLRVFRRVTGTTPHQYVLGARLRLAGRLLLDTGRPVTEIAYAVGFQDLSNFVRTFRRAAGCSPRAYRAR